MPFKIVTQFVVNPILEFLKDSRSVGIILLIATCFSLLVANSPFQHHYASFWEFHWTLPNWLHLPHSLIHFINDGLMAVFFFLVGMEIKRELIDGELSDLKTAILPIAAAIGGMIVPALIYSLFNKGTQYSHGWGIPTATDIAFSLGVASLLGKRFPFELKVFLMALAIIDDLGAILVIALFYGGQVHWVYLVAAGVILGLIYLIKWRAIESGGLFLVLSLLLWYCFYNSGIHPTIAGVIIAFLISRHQLNHLIHRFHDPVNFIILPLFALGNTAISIAPGAASALSSSLSLGIIFGLVMGKPFGIYLGTRIAMRVTKTSLPNGISLFDLIGMGMLAGIGFTMSIFIASLAFDPVAHKNEAKLAVLLASFLAMALGYVWMYFQKEKTI